MIDFTSRLEKIRNEIVRQKLDAVFVSSVSNIIYLTGFSNFSIEEREAYLIITKTKQYIITDGRYTEAVRREVPHFEVVERSVNNRLKDIFAKLLPEVKILGIEEDNLKVSEYKFIKKYFKKLKGIDISKIREIKEVEEIDKIAKACQIGDLLFDYVLKKIKIGVSEKEIAWEMEKFVKENRAAFSFDPIIAFGANSSVPHHQTSDKRLTINDKLVLLDFGVKYDNYCSDMTRTVFLGSPSEKQKDIYETVKIAQQKAVEFIENKLSKEEEIKINDVDKEARDYIISKGYPDIPHSLGHGIGLQVHEYPYISLGSKEILKDGVVFSIEPGVYLENFGGVRIEDLFVIEGSELKQLTKAGKELIVI